MISNHTDDHGLTFVFLALKKQLSVVEKLLAVAYGYLIGAFAELVEVKLAIVAHAGNIGPIVQKSDQLLRLNLGLI